jgi:hypothetical protein
MSGRLIERLCIQTLAPEGKAAVSRFQDIVNQYKKKNTATPVTLTYSHATQV